MRAKGLILVIICLVAGCAQPTRTEVPRALWDPGACAGAMACGHGAWTQQTMNGLLWRLNYPAFWSLVDRLLAHAPEADHVIIAEYVPSNPAGAEYYWFGMLVQKGSDFWCYTSGLPPSVRSERERRYKDHPRGVWGRVGAHSKPQVLLDMLERARLLQDSGGALAIWDNGFAIEARPWLIHVYRADGQIALRMMADHPMLHPDVVFGKEDLTHLNQLFDSGGPTDAEMRSVSSALEDFVSRGKLLEEYRGSYPMRLVLTGLFRIIYAEWPAKAHH